ncbi:hypothetical protein RA280_22535 [Cupriavidus sp. CV2]|uniref:hypothetical protein n=1 Tax=Cupriavidus ulmosensis TaxID=3065913 RepID=UPI00296AEE81|nr:hypothetical protein [Cupriavidus sp. CV2]MDW3684477.1 hypothetical protein [Cupriavidus sp. CV2]
MNPEAARECRMSNAQATDEAFWERIRSAYPTQQPLLAHVVHGVMAAACEREAARMPEATETGDTDARRSRPLVLQAWHS